MVKKVKDISFDEFMNFSDEDWVSYSDEDLDFLFEKYVRHNTVDGMVEGVSVRELMERFGFSVDGFDDRVLDLVFNVDFVDGFIRRNKFVFTDSLDKETVGVELVLNRDSVDKCVEFRSGRGVWVYSDLGGLMSVS